MFCKSESFTTGRCLSTSPSALRSPSTPILLSPFYSQVCFAIFSLCLCSPYPTGAAHQIPSMDYCQFPSTRGRYHAPRSFRAFRTFRTENL